MRIDHIPGAPNDDDPIGVFETSFSYAVRERCSLCRKKIDPERASLLAVMPLEEKELIGRTVCNACVIEVAKVIDELQKKIAKTQKGENHA